MVDRWKGGGAQSDNPRGRNLHHIRASCTLSTNERRKRKWMLLKKSRESTNLESHDRSHDAAHHIPLSQIGRERENFPDIDDKSNKSMTPSLVTQIDT